MKTIERLEKLRADVVALRAEYQAARSNGEIAVPAMNLSIANDKLIRAGAPHVEALLAVAKAAEALQDGMNKTTPLWRDSPTLLFATGVLKNALATLKEQGNG